MIVPVFALANAGVVISSDSIADAAASPVTHGIVAGLVVGKAVGIFGFTWLACRLGIGALPDGRALASRRGDRGARWHRLHGVAVRVEPRVPRTPALAADAKLGVLTASVIAALAGTAILLMTTRNRARQSEPGP